jgi:hypothetical protein
MRFLKLFVLLFFAAALALPFAYIGAVEGQSGTEALTTNMDAKTDDLWNGFTPKGTPIDECEGDPVPNRSFEDNKFIFEERENVGDGLGLLYNDVACHQSPDTGAASQISELRAGHVTNGIFVDAPGGSLINDRATDSDVFIKVR